MTEYNGWKNYETWNVSLWINNDEELYNLAYGFMSKFSGRAPYANFVKSFGLEGTKTPDGVSFNSSKVSRRELNSMLKELHS